MVAQVNGSQVGLEDLLFWGIRLTVVGTLINPIIYGIFARQYRVGYMYVLRLAFSKVFSCVDPPAKNIFGTWCVVVNISVVLWVDSPISILCRT